MGRTAKTTLFAVIGAWLLTRVLRRVVGVAVLVAVSAGALSVASGHGVDVGDARRVLACEKHAIARLAEHLRDSASSSAPTSQPDTRRLVRRLGTCHRTTTSPALPHGHRGPR